MPVESKFQLKGAQQLERTLNELPKNLARNVLRGGVRAAAKVMQTSAKQKVPVDDGDLRDGIIIKEDRLSPDSVTMQVGTRKGIGYAHLVEFGSVKMRAQPFLRPALDENAENIFKVMGNSMAKSLARQAKRAAGKFSKSGFNK
jgi:HK97 gp10 family phage protein